MRKNGEKRRYLRYAVIAILVVFLLVCALLLLEEWEKSRGRFPERDITNEVVSYGGAEYVLKDNVETFLVMGLDKFEGDSAGDSYNNDKQADFLMLFVLDKDSQKCGAIHINRDTMTNINVLGVAGQRIDTVNKQIALAHTYGNGKEVSCRNTSDAVSELLNGMKINHYISFTMDSVPTFNDLVGGVELTVLEDFTGIDDTLIKGENVVLTGEHALNYVRTRYGLDDSTNSTRMERQKQYINALYDKTLQCIEKDDQFIVNASLEMADYIVSDRSVTQLQELLKKITTYEFSEIVTIDGETVVGEKFMEFYPKDESINEIVIEMFYSKKDN